MKQAKLLSVVLVGVSFFGSTTLAYVARGSGAGRPGGGPVGRFSGGFRSGIRRGFPGRFFSGFHSGHFGVNHHHYWGWRGCYPSTCSFVYAYWPQPYYCSYYAPPPVYDSPPVVYSSPDDYSSSPDYSAPPAVVYGSPPPAPEAENSQPTVDNRALPPTSIGRDMAAASSPAQREPESQYSPQIQSLGVAEVKTLVKAGLSEKVILNQIRNSHVVYHLSAVEIIDLTKSGVSENIINFMLGASPAASSTSDLPFKLTGIMSLPEGGLGAVINGKVVAEKSYVDGATVKKIDRDQVTLDLNGHEFVVWML